MSLRVLEGIADKSWLPASRDDIELDAGRRSDLCPGYEPLFAYSRSRTGRTGRSFHQRLVDAK